MDILRQCIAGLRHLHEENDIIHRDVRSANIMVDAKKGSLRVVLADFGISHHLSMKRLSVADKRHLIGPVWWIAPEVLSSATNHGTVPVTTASDVYMLGGLMFEVLNGGNRPYWWSHEEKLRSDNVFDVAERCGEAIALPSFGAVAPLVAIAKRCLAANPDDRPVLSEVDSLLETALPSVGEAPARAVTPGAQLLEVEPTIINPYDTVAPVGVRCVCACAALACLFVVLLPNKSA